MIAAQDLPERVLALLIPACNPKQLQPAARAEAARYWKEVLLAAQNIVPGATNASDGLCLMRARGPARYYGDEVSAAQAVLASIDFLPDRLNQGVSIGIASGRFAAEQAARSAHPLAFLEVPAHGIHFVQAEHTKDFLAGLPINTLTDETLATVLLGLGIQTIGEFSILPEDSVLERFGSHARIAHRRGRGLGEPHGEEVLLSEPVADLALSFEFEPPLDGADQLAFAASAHAEAFVEQLKSRGLVCTELQVILTDDVGIASEQHWSHPSNFTPADVVSRLRWQATSLPEASERGSAGIATVRLSPLSTAKAADHEPGLWNSTPDEKVHYQLTRVQSILGPKGVGTGTLLGGRRLTDRQKFTPWGSQQYVPTQAERLTAPWPGHLIGSLPILACPKHASVSLTDAQQQLVTIDDDELLSARPTYFEAAGYRGQVRSWSSPWPLREGWWRPSSENVYRMQLELEDGDAWLLNYTVGAGWSAEGRYS